ncbi:MAG: hypothetical protein BYD32DRAFT_431094 [Podila humilis]|nr:MAG: hypothetical protein BYD32DRAFT_431094 [Podila humilis]
MASPSHPTHNHYFIYSLSTIQSSMGGNHSSDGAHALSEALKTKSTQTTLELRGNKIGRNEARAMSKALRTNSTLTTLSF